MNQIYLFEECNNSRKLLEAYERNQRGEKTMLIHIYVLIYNICFSLSDLLHSVWYSLDLPSSVQSLSRVWLWDPMDSSMSGIPVHHQLPEFTQTHVCWVGDAIHPSHPLSSPSPPTFISNDSALRMRWTKYWSFSFSISLSHEYSGLLSFRMDWLDLLAVQGTLKTLLQHHSSKASIPQCSVFIIVQLSHPYMTTGKTIALTR